MYQRVEIYEDVGTEGERVQKENEDDEDERELHVEMDGITTEDGQGEDEEEGEDNKDENLYYVLEQEGSGVEEMNRMLGGQLMFLRQQPEDKCVDDNTTINTVEDTIERKHLAPILTADSEGEEYYKEVKTSPELKSSRPKVPCPFCNKMLTRLDEHIRLLHRNKVYPCPKPGCGVQCHTLKNLQSHQLTCFNMLKTYQCEVCSKQFHRKSNLKNHLRRHDVKRFRCELCQRTFVDSTGLRRHFTKHHDNQQQVFISSCCKKMFKSKDGMKKHMEKRVCGMLSHPVSAPD